MWQEVVFSSSPKTKALLRSHLKIKHSVYGNQRCQNIFGKESTPSPSKAKKQSTLYCHGYKNHTQEAKSNLQREEMDRVWGNLVTSFCRQAAENDLRADALYQEHHEAEAGGKSTGIRLQKEVEEKSSGKKHCR